MRRRVELLHGRRGQELPVECVREHAHARHDLLFHRQVGIACRRIVGVARHVDVAASEFCADAGHQLALVAQPLLDSGCVGQLALLQDGKEGLEGREFAGPQVCGDEAPGHG